MANLIKAFPSFFLNYKNDLSQINELCGDETGGTAIGDFKAHYRDLYDLINDALYWNDDPDSGAPVFIAIDLYNSLLDDFRLILEEKSDVSERLKYVLSGIRKSIQRDFEDEILVINDTDASFGGAYSEYVQNNAGALAVGAKVKLKNAIQRLQAVSLYMTDNCPEYVKLLEDASVIETLGADKRVYRDASDKLYQSAQAYIDSRKIVPGGETGKDRLSIAKELRDIGRSLSRNLELDIASDVKAASNRTVKEKLEDKLQKAVDELKQAWDTNNALIMRDCISIIVYLDGIEKKAFDLTDDKIKDLISNARIKASIKQINKITSIVAAKFDLKGFCNAALDGTLKNFVVNSFNKYAAAATAELKAARTV